jgi:hypothetical protein
MTLVWVLLAAALALGIRGVYFYRQLQRFDSFLYSLDRRDETYWLTLFIDYGTLMGFAVVAACLVGFYMPPQLPWPIRFTTVFVAWTGVGLLERFQLHMARRMSEYDLAVAWRTNLIMVGPTAVAMTAAYGVYRWWWS